MQEAGADALVASAGSLSLEQVCENVPNLSQVVWVVPKASRQMDWGGVPPELDSKLSVSIWHDLVDGNTSTTATDLPENSHTKDPGHVVTFWQEKPNAPAQIVHFTQKVAAMSCNCCLSPS